MPLEAGVGASGAAQLLARALTLVPSDSHDAGRLLSRYGTVLGLVEGDYEEAQEAFGRALAIAQHVGDVALEMWTLPGPPLSPPSIFAGTTLWSRAGRPSSWPGG